MGATPVTSAEAQRLLWDLDVLAQTFVDTGNRLVHVLNRADELLGALLSDLGRLIAELVQKLQDAWKTIQPYLKGTTGWPWQLWDAGDLWTTQVGARASALVAAVDAAQLSADDHWQGAAHDAYAQAVPQQTKALAAVKASCDDIDDALTTIGWAQIAFVATLSAAIGVAVAQYLAEGAAAATGVGAPPAAAAAGLTTVQLITVVAAIVTAFVTIATTVSKTCTDLQQRLDNNDAFIGTGGAAQWPRATSGITRPDEWKPRS